MRIRDGYRVDELTNLEMPRTAAKRFGTDLAVSIPMKTVLLGKQMLLNVTAKKPDETSPVALLTPTYGRDLELCTLLCESVDRHVGSFSKHYLLVPDSDVPLFAHFASERRSILPASDFLPTWLRPLPRIIQRKRRQYWWSFRAKPVSGWHVQQILKIAATISLPHRRYCILDSDVVFFRDFDLAHFEYPNPIPLLHMPDEVTPAQIRHSRWVETSHQLLGLPKQSFPASDFIGHIMFWDQPTTRAMTSKIEAVTKLEWIDALCQTREFSEYMLYGYFVQSDVNFSSKHALTARTPCVSYWDQPKLDRTELNRLLRGANEDDVAFSVASFSGTPVQTIRAAIEEMRTIRTPSTVTKKTAGLGALC
jgi:hypothetical protein